MLGRAWARLDSFVRDNSEAILAFAEQFTESATLAEAEWLPFYPVSIPPGAWNDRAEIDSVVTNIYRSDWAAVRGLFEANLADCNFDPSITAGFRQALDLHELGHYRAVCTLLFPQMEQLVRRQFRIPVGKMATGLKELRSRLRDVRLSEHLSERRFRALALFVSIEEHVFASAKNEEALAKFAASSIPNRHACIHGLVDYSSFKSSINCLIIAHYVFLMTHKMTALKPL